MTAHAERFRTDHAQRFLAEILDPATSCIEMRIFHAGFERGFIVRAEQYSRTLAGWFNQLDRLIYEASRLDGISGFVTVNPCQLDLMARQQSNRVGKIDRGGATNDTQIVCFRNAFLDFDAERPSDVSATRAELEAVLEVRDRFLAEHPEVAASSIWGCSGNGGWILPRLPDLPNNPESESLVKRFLAVVGRKYDQDKVKIDRKTYNASRIMGIAGTVKCKGSNQPDRPWRVATIDSPEGHVRTPLDLRAWLAEHDDQPEPTAPPPLALGRPPSWMGPPSALNAPDSNLVRRISAFVAAIPGAVSGDGGHRQTFSVATALIKGFGLSIADAWPFLAGYNTTCVPPWTDAELQHKLEEADAIPDSRPRGYLIHAAPRRPRLEPDLAGQVFEFGGESQANGHAAQRGGEAAANGQADANGQVASNGQAIYDGEVVEARPIETPHQLARNLVGQFYRHPDGLTLRFWKEEFHLWNGGCYKPIPRKEMTALVTRSIAAQYQAEFDEQMIAHAMARQGRQGGGDGEKKGSAPKLRPVTTGGVNDVLQALTDITLLRAAECPNQPGWIDHESSWAASEVLPMRDALVHLPSWLAGRSATARPTPNFFGHYSLNYRFDPDASSPSEWLQFLETLWPDDPDSVALLQEWMGNLLTPDTSHQKILMMIGPPRSGKGTIARVITALLGSENVSSPTLGQMATRFGLEPLIGKPAAIIADARISGRTDTAIVVERLLSISGEDTQTIERKYKSETTIRLPTRFTIISNELPNIRDASGALSSRFLILELVQSFLGREDPTLFGRFMTELPNILRWAMDGWARLRERGHFTRAAASENLTEAMHDLTSPIKAFLRERCEIGAGHRTPVADLYQEWKLWCAHKGREHPGDDETLGRMLRAAVPGLKRSRPVVDGVRVNCYLGVKLLSPAELAAIDGDEDAHQPQDFRF